MGENMSYHMRCLALFVCGAVFGVSTFGSACKTPESIVVIRAGDPCLFVPPPVPKKVSYPACTVAVACLDGPNADALADNLEASQRWQETAWIRCGPSPDAGR